MAKVSLTIQVHRNTTVYAWLFFISKPLYIKILILLKSHAKSPWITVRPGSHIKWIFSSKYSDPNQLNFTAPVGLFLVEMEVKIKSPGLQIYTHLYTYIFLLILNYKLLPLGTTPQNIFFFTKFSINDKRCISHYLWSGGRTELNPFAIL